jgi:hypothetical protein
VEEFSCFEVSQALSAPPACTDTFERVGKAVGSEEGKGLGSGLRYRKKKEVKHGLYCL